MSRLLLVDGSLTVRMDLDEAFRGASWSTVLCASAGAAREALRTERFDVIILDVLLADGSGLDLLRELRTSPATAAVPIMLLANKADVADQIAGFPSGADDYVDLPYDRAVVVSRAERLAADRRPVRPVSPVVLAVDDSATYLAHLVSELEGDDFEVIGVASGEAALDLLARRGVDCVLLDMVMPDMSGEAVCRHIRESTVWRAIPVIMLTAREDRGAVLEAFAAGADDYVGKSSDVAILRARLTAQLRRRRVEQETQQVRDQLHKRDVEIAEAQAASRAKDHFLAVLSHELRTPLTPVLAAVALLERETLPESARARLEIVRRNVQLQARLIDDLLDLTSIVRAKIELDRRPVELCTVLERAAEVCRPDIEARQLEFGIDYGPRPYVIEADVARLQQVFWNLIKNAIKFTPKGGCVGVRCRPDGSHVTIEIIDSGIGIEPAAIGRIFDAFTQAELSITRQFGGLGLGLTISKVLVEMHGGTIAAHSAGRNRGATFTVRLPMVSASVGRTAERRRHLRRDERSLSILLVEDHGDTAEMMATVLDMHGHRVQRAGDVAAALDLAAQGDFDLLISDLGLPDRSGLDLVRDLRSRGSSVPAIALSGYGQDEDLRRSRAAGFGMHLVKPVDPDYLLRAIEEITRNS